ncbi:fungal-specific transcription factor domain-containing protein [Mycena leptocephala]|nr:fungal-specific transcription factor domain-containing protein [Mycena leptocephala]
MSASEATSMDEHGSQKKNKRACDACRRRKRDGGDRCASCVRFQRNCTYEGPAAVRNVGDAAELSASYDSYGSNYVADLERRLKTAEASLQQSKPCPPMPPLYVRAIRSIEKPFSPPHPEDSEFADIADSFRALSLGNAPPDPGFRGKSSAAMLVKAAVVVTSGGGTTAPQTRYRTPPATEPWMRPWGDDLMIPLHSLSFPAEHLMQPLVSLFFSNVNLFIPVLHRPTFEECMHQGLHMRDLGFGTLLLLVCCLGALYLPEPTISNTDRQKLAWKWYNQVELCGHSLRHPTLYDIQAYCLAVQFLHCTSNPRSAWVIAGFGVRLAQDLGLHRHKFKARTSTVAEELEKRAFWILAFLDTQLSGSTGRSAMLDPVQTDVTMPCECDDEYWHRLGPGIQPPNKPSTTSFFNCLLSLYRILHYLLRTLYTTRANHIRARRVNLMPNLAAELNSALTKWFSSIPDHLIWHSDHPDTLFFEQSAVLHCLYYYTRILIHRPFIPGVSSMVQSDPQALGICAAAARACILVADTHRRRRPDNPLLFSQSPVFTAAMILIINEWSNPPSPRNPRDDLAHVFATVDILKTQQERWPSSGLFITVLERLLSLDPDAPPQFSDHPDALNPTILLILSRLYFSLTLFQLPPLHPGWADPNQTRLHFIVGLSMCRRPPWQSRRRSWAMKKSSPGRHIDRVLFPEGYLDTRVDVKICIMMGGYVGIYIDLVPSGTPYST